MIRLLVATVLFLGTALSALAAMSGNEIRSALVGKSLSWKNGKYSGTASYASDGSAKQSIMRIYKDNGRWAIKGNQLCITWYKVRGGKEVCNTVQKTDPTTYNYSSGTIVTVE